MVEAFNQNPHLGGYGWIPMVLNELGYRLLRFRVYEDHPRF